MDRTPLGQGGGYSLRFVFVGRMGDFVGLMTKRTVTRAIVWGGLKKMRPDVQGGEICDARFSEPDGKNV